MYNKCNRIRPSTPRNSKRLKATAKPSTLSPWWRRSDYPACKDYAAPLKGPSCNCRASPSTRKSKR